MSNAVDCNTEMNIQITENCVVGRRKMKSDISAVVVILMFISPQVHGGLARNVRNCLKIFSSAVRQVSPISSPCSHVVSFRHVMCESSPRITHALAFIISSRTAAASAAACLQRSTTDSDSSLP